MCESNLHKHGKNLGSEGPGRGTWKMREKFFTSPPGALEREDRLELAGDVRKPSRHPTGQSGVAKGRWRVYARLRPLTAATSETVAGTGSPEWESGGGRSQRKSQGCCWSAGPEEKNCGVLGRRELGQQRTCPLLFVFVVIADHSGFQRIKATVVVLLSTSPANFSFSQL